MRSILFCLALLLVGCGSGNKTVWDGPPASEAEAAYRKALNAFESGQYIDAMTQFNELRLKYPYSSRWTTLAELRQADVLADQGRHAAAAVSYQEFINAHPTHEDVAYAQYQIGICSYKEMPMDVFFLPAPHQRELATTRQAESAFKRLLAKFPDYENAEEARAKLAEVRERLATYELYVAEFNFKKAAYYGTVKRTETLLQSYPDSSQADDALLLQAHAYIKLEDVDMAIASLQRLLADYPDSEFVPEAQSWLDQYAPT
ncbi:MAG: outer membrane protein assembly factor BamD [Myxococcota bacterium]|jgi:outer membrane protein assembly factor BamD|nr:outer membrane protein assembly factor BamD [Myxococcota bacterium]